jgi:hypothetical protein
METVHSLNRKGGMEQAKEVSAPPTTIYDGDFDDSNDSDGVNMPQLTYLATRPIQHDRGTLI